MDTTIGMSAPDFELASEPNPQLVANLGLLPSEADNEEIEDHGRRRDNDQQSKTHTQIQEMTRNEINDFALTLQTSLQLARGRVQHLESLGIQERAAKADVLMLQAQVAEAKAENETLKMQNTDMLSQNLTLATGKSDIEAQNATLKTQLVDIRAENGALKTQLAETNGENATLKTKLARIEARNAAQLAGRVGQKPIVQYNGCKQQ